MSSFTNKTEFIDPKTNTSRCDSPLEIKSTETRYGMVGTYLGNETVIYCGGYADGQYTMKDCLRYSNSESSTH